MTRAVGDAFAGFLVPWRGLGLVFSNARIARFALLPFLVTILLFGTGLAIGLPLVTSWVAPLTVWMTALFGIAAASTTASILAWVLPIALWPTLAIGLCLVIWMIARLAVGPLFILLAEAVLVSSGAIEKKPFVLGEWTKTNLKMLQVSLLRAVVFGILGVLLLVLSLIPVVGLVAGFAMLVLLAFDLADYALEVYEWGLRDRIGFYRRHFPVFLGFAAILGLVFLMPGLNFFLLPASVAGATDVVRRLVAETRGK